MARETKQQRIMRENRQREQQKNWESLPPQEKLAGNIIVAILWGGGLALLISMFRSCAPAPTPVTPPHPTTLQEMGRDKARKLCEDEAIRQMVKIQPGVYKISLDKPGFFDSRWHTSANIYADEGREILKHYSCEISGTLESNAIVKVTLSKPLSRF